MAGFTDWIKDNVMIPFIPTAIFASMVVKAEPLHLIDGLLLLFVISFLITCLVRLISIIIYNMQ